MRLFEFARHDHSDPLRADARLRQFFDKGGQQDFGGGRTRDVVDDDGDGRLSPGKDGQPPAADRLGECPADRGQPIRRGRDQLRQ